MADKTCVRCGVTRSINDFYENPTYRDGRASWCKVCVGRRSSSATAFARLDAIKALGGVCVGFEKPCGYDDVRALCIDHPTGGGIEDRASHKAPLKFYRYVAAHPDEYQLLCANCNTIKRSVLKEHRRGQFSDVEVPEFDRPLDRGEAMAQLWDDPEYRAKQSASRSAAWSDERRQKTAERAEARRQALIQQVEANRTAMPSGDWGGGYAHCLGCERSDRAHKQRGICGTCYATINRDPEKRAKRAAQARRTLPASS